MLSREPKSPLSVLVFARGRGAARDDGVICVATVGAHLALGVNHIRRLLYSDFDCRPGNRENLRYSQAELGPAIRSAVAYFADISGGAIAIRVLYTIHMNVPNPKTSLQTPTPVTPPV